MGQQIFVAFVRFFGVTHTRVLAHGPKPPAIHGRLNPACIWEVAGVTGLLVVVPILQICDGVKRSELALWAFVAWGYFFLRDLKKELIPNQPNIKVNPTAAATLDPGALPA